MLDINDIELINKNIYTEDHNFLIYKEILGEPFLQHGILYYFDEKKISLSILGFFLKRNTNNSDVIKLLRNFIRKNQVRIINYVGPNYLSFPKEFKEDYCYLTFLPPNNFNVEMGIDLNFDNKFKKIRLKKNIEIICHTKMYKQHGE